MFPKRVASSWQGIYAVVTASELTCYVIFLILIWILRIIRLFFWDCLSSWFWYISSVYGTLFLGLLITPPVWEIHKGFICKFCFMNQLVCSKLISFISCICHFCFMIKLLCFKLISLSVWTHVCWSYYKWYISIKKKKIISGT